MNNLNDDEVTLLAIKGVVSELTDEDRLRFDQLVKEIRFMVKNAGDIGVLAIALLGAELQMDNAGE